MIVQSGLPGLQIHLQCATWSSSRHTLRYCRLFLISVDRTYFKIQKISKPSLCCRYILVLPCISRSVAVSGSWLASPAWLLRPILLFKASYCRFEIFLKFKLFDTNRGSDISIQSYTRIPSVWVPPRFSWANLVYRFLLLWSCMHPRELLCA